MFQEHQKSAPQPAENKANYTAEINKNLNLKHYELYKFKYIKDLLASLSSFVPEYRVEYFSFSAHTV